MPITKPAAIQYPVGLLDVGDSFFIPALTTTMHMNIAHKRAAALGYTLEYKAGIDSETGLYGIRIIRVA